MKYKIVEPLSDEEWTNYLNCRWETLRKPWDQPKGSEEADDDDESFHAMALDNEKVCGVIRLSEAESGIFQVRFMGVDENYRGKGIGSLLLRYMENLTKAKKGNKIILHARENALPFYKANGYEILEKSYLLFNEIQHFKMSKVLR